MKTKDFVYTDKGDDERLVIECAGLNDYLWIGQVGHGFVGTIRRLDQLKKLRRLVSKAINNRRSK